MQNTPPSFTALDDFVRPIIGLPAWGVTQGHGSFLTFEFGKPIPISSDARAKGRGPSGAVRSRGHWHLWIYCCHWRASQDGVQLAWSEDPRSAIERATRALNGKRLLAVSIERESGRSTFTFEAGLTLETWPYGDDPADKQWTILTANESFGFRADGFYSHGPSDIPVTLVRWSPFT